MVCQKSMPMIEGSAQAGSVNQSGAVMPDDPR